MKINILTIASLVLTAPLVTGNPADTFSNEQAVTNLMRFRYWLNVDEYQYYLQNSQGTELLRSTTKAKGMLNVIKGIENNVFEGPRKDEIATFLSTDIGKELEKDLVEISKDDTTISIREATTSLLFFAKFHAVNPFRFTRWNEEVLKHYYSKKTANAMLTVITAAETNSLTGPFASDVKKFLASKTGQEFKSDLTNIANSGDVSISNEEVIDALLYKIKYFTGSSVYYIYDKEAIQRLYSKEMTKAMVKVIQDVEKGDFKGDDEDKDTITTFLSSKKGSEFKECLIRYRNYNDKATVNRAGASLERLTKTYYNTDLPYIALDEEFKKRLYSWEMAEAMFKVIEVIENNGSDESDMNMITEFLASANGEMFKEALTSIINSGKRISNYEFLQGSNPRTSATTKVTFTQLAFIVNVFTERVFSINEILAAVCALKGATVNLSDST
ncbi:hypothetical protein IWQ61_004932 [Dispira simplex]|nr:hypothetical protein IWQ61_004932 [Dispira simplex]